MPHWLPHATPLSCAFVLAACSVYSDPPRDPPIAGPGAGGDSALPSAGSGGSSGAHDGGNPNSGSTSAGGGGEADAGSPSSEGGSDAGGSGFEGGAGGAPAVDPSDSLIDDFEDQNLTIEKKGGRDGLWYLFNDGTTGSAGPSPLVCSPLVDAPAALGSQGMHITATGFTSWGSGLGADFRLGRMVYDGSKYSGVRFWARVGAGKNTRHRLQLADGTTDPLGGKCDPASDAAVGEKCADHFGMDQVFTTTWSQYEVPFSALDQAGWGKGAAELDKTTLYGVQIIAQANQQVDLWLDQLEFF